MSPALDLEHRYRATEGAIYVNGTQALVRLLIAQADRDRAAGHRTAGYVTGYRGSPLGTLDLELARARAHLEARQIVVRPAINEDLAATAVWGTQQVPVLPGPTVEGVFALWYGKSPGVDRSGDALKHANAAGTSALGGVLAVAGDDHAGKSSSLPNQSDYALVDAMVPILSPADVGELIAYGLWGWAASRYSGLWQGLKLPASIVDTSRRVRLDQLAPAAWATPDYSVPEDGVHLRLRGGIQAAERRLVEVKHPAFRAWRQANQLDRAYWRTAESRYGIVCAGKSYRDVQEALALLGIDEARARALGLAIYKPAVVWPIDETAAAAFSRGLHSVLVVEEKRPLIESQWVEAVYRRLSDRITVVGKRDDDDGPLVPALGEHDPRTIAAIIARWLRLEPPPAAQHPPESLTPLIARTPYFCSGCPHNTSTVVPEGSLAFGGIGCHGMATMMSDRPTIGLTHMGGEGATWIGVAPFTTTRHAYQNLGDGTWHHSGSLAVRAAVAAGVRLTYKLLYNEVVAMTGGQPIDGPISLPRVVEQLLAEGVRAIAIVARTPERWRGRPWPAAVTVYARESLEAAQRRLREVDGVSVLLYEQPCATESRRRRKRGRLPAVSTRVMINPEVCEGCGDCSVQSNCLSVVPLETEFGGKRVIDQTSCNVDLSCLRGFCPSFVTVDIDPGETPSHARARQPTLPDVPDPDETTDAWRIAIVGVGGTGVTTLSALIGMAAHLSDREVAVYDMTGLSQKAGAVYSHVSLGGPGGTAPWSAQLPRASADLLLACDPGVATNPDAMSRLAVGGRVVTTTTLAPPGGHGRDPFDTLPHESVQERLASAAGPGCFVSVDAGAWCQRAFGSTAVAPVLLLGVAFQHGWIPLPSRSLERAIEINGVAVADNLLAFRLGRALVHAPREAEGLWAEAELQSRPTLAEMTTDALIGHRTAHLVAYQDERYARQYRAVVERVAASGDDRLTRAVAEELGRLMSYKDEYEVARLLLDERFTQTLASSFGPRARVHYHLAPPLHSRPDQVTGRPRKRRFGAWLKPWLVVLKHAKRVRGTALDPFGHTAERRLERSLIDLYEADIELLLSAASTAMPERLLALARWPAHVRGYGPVRQQAIERALALRARARDAILAPHEMAGA